MRFRIEKEIVNNKLYREFFVNYDEFKNDINLKKYEVKNDLLKKLINNSKKYFYQQRMLIKQKTL